MSDSLDLIKRLKADIEAVYDSKAGFESGRDLLEDLIKGGYLKEVCYSYELDDSLLSLSGDWDAFSEGLFEEVCERIVMEREREE